MYKSYNEISLKSICQEVGISTGHLSYYFPKKEQLITNSLSQAIRKFGRILKEELDFVDAESLGFYLAIEYLIFFVACDREEFRKTYLSLQKLPDVIISESRVLIDNYFQIFEEIGADSDRDRIFLSHMDLYFHLTNSYYLLQEGEIHTTKEEIFDRGIRNFLWMCGLNDELIRKYIDQMYRIISLIDREEVFVRAIEMETMDYDEI